MDVTITLDDARVRSLFGQLAAAGADLTPAMGRIAPQLETSIRVRFERETGPDGKPWIPSRRAREEGGQTLVESGDLLSSMSHAFGPTFAAAGPERSGGAAVYAAIHQLGGTIRPKAKKALAFGGRVLGAVRIPARPYLGFDDGDREMIVDVLTGHLRAALGEGAPA